MKTIAGHIFTILMIGMTSVLGAQNMNTSPDNTKSVIFSLGERVSEKYFKGNAWASPLVPKEEVFNCPIYNVTFEPGARNNWHRHPGGQILLVTSGTGWYQERGKPAQVLHEGDIVRIPPDVEHWHGAAADSRFTHLAISTNIQKGDVVWLERVSDEEYDGLSRKDKK